MHRFIVSPRTWSIVGVRGPGVSVFGLQICSSVEVWVVATCCILRPEIQNLESTNHAGAYQFAVSSLVWDILVQLSCCPVYIWERS